MLHWWSDFRSRFDLASLRETIIWNNHNIRVNGKPIFYNNYNSANIVLLSDLKFDLSNTESFNLAKQNGLRDSNFLTWTGVRCAVPSHLRIRSCEVNRDHVRSLCNLKSVTEFLIQHLVSLGTFTGCLYPVRRQSPEAS